MDKKISVLGSTGSIGVQTLDVVRMHGIKVTALSAYSNIKLLESQAREFKPEKVCAVDRDSAYRLKIALADTSIKVLSGVEGVVEAATEKSCDTVLNAIVGAAGLVPTLKAIDAGKNIALANKETLVAGGSIVMKKAAESGINIYPVDSEHSAIFQCLQGCPKNSLKKIILTASGGSFFGRTRDELKNITVRDALKHPNWSMGRKITVDSSTMMNKGLEVIEASWLFDVGDENIDVLVHRESIIHSMIQLRDNAVIAQLGAADMRIPIQYALTYPNRLPSPARELNFSDITGLSFYNPDYETFECLSICRSALSKGGLYPAVVNAANEAAVELFLDGKISFLEIGETVRNAFEEFNYSPECITVDDILSADRETRRRISDKFSDRY